MRIFITILLFIASIASNAQKLEIFGGVTQNRLYQYFDDNTKTTEPYTNGNGYLVGLAISDIKLDKLSLRFTLHFESYNGGIEYCSCGNGATSTETAKIDKSVLSLGIFPVNFQVLKKIKINSGIEISHLFSESFEGTRSSYSYSTRVSETIDLHDVHDRLSSKAYFGLKTRIAYEFNLGDHIVIAPQYSFYHGFSKEFKEIQNAKSMRHFLGIGIEWRLRSKKETSNPNLIFPTPKP